MQTLGWNRAEQDIITHYASASTIHWLIAASKDDPEKAAGTIVPFVFDNATGWVGFFIVHKDYQGLGWGARLFARCLEVFEENNVEYVGLDAVEEQVKTYERRGFRATDRVNLMVRKSLKETPLKEGFEHVETDGERLVPLSDIPSNILVESDLSVTGLKRGTLWSKKAMFEDRDDAWGLALVSHHAKDELDGWILVRSCQDGFRIGPLYAKSKKDAAFLLHQALYRLRYEDSTFIAEVWANNREAIVVFEEAGWSYSGMDYHRMWLDGKVPKEQMDGGKAETEMWAVFDAGEG
jgi:GNAT superfamily N-acetyltransferase